MIGESHKLPLMMRGFYWQELELGNLGRTLRRTITETDLVNFISVTGMLEAIFIDAEYPGAVIPGRLVPASLTQGLIEGMLFQTIIQATGLALLECHTKALKPVRVGDSIWAHVEITQIKPTSRYNRAIVTSDICVLNQSDECVLTYTVKRMLAGRPEASNTPS